MEYFATDPRVLSTFAKHHKTRHVMPDDMIAKLCKADKICAATEMQTQVEKARLRQFASETIAINGGARGKSRARQNTSIDQWFLTGGGHASPVSVNKFSEGREPLRALQRGKFLNGKVFRPTCLFQVRGGGGLETQDCYLGRRGRKKGLRTTAIDECCFI